jgi:MoaA/NifB/PqqE/SkfB family radical SAM enzyme
MAKSTKEQGAATGAEAISPRCTAPWQSMMVEGNGVVQPCAYRGNYGNASMHPPLGNVNESSLEEIWNGPEMQNLRRLMAEGDLRAAGCGGCLAVAQGLPLNLAYDARIDEDDAPNSDYRDNVFLKRKEVAAGKTVIESKPLVLYVTPTHRCNLRCTHCYETPTRTDTIRRDGFQDEVENLLPYLSELVPGGGEPLLLSFWQNSFRNPVANQNPYLRLSFTTGAHYVTDTMFENIGRFNDAQVMVSFDAPNAKTFEAIRKNASFERVVENMAAFRDITVKKREGSTVMHISVMKQNIRLLPEMIRLAAAMEVPFNFQPVVAYPVDHSLRVFEHGSKEVEGWRAALDKTRELIRSVLVPSLEAAAKRRGRTPDPSMPEMFQNHITALSNLVPWDVAEQKHRLYSGEIPVYQQDYLKLLGRYGLKEHQQGQQMLIAFHPKTGDTTSEPHHYARVDTDGRFRAILPPGEYLACLMRRDTYAVPYNGFDVSVSDTVDMNALFTPPVLPISTESQA